MTVSTSNIWKSATAAVRRSGGERDANLPIGETLRDLYCDDQMPKADGRFASLLDTLDAAEKKHDGRH